MVATFRHPLLAPPQDRYESDKMGEVEASKNGSVWNSSRIGGDGWPHTGNNTAMEE